MGMDYQRLLLSSLTKILKLIELLTLDYVARRDRYCDELSKLRLSKHVR